MPREQIIHLIIVGLIFLAVLALLAVFLRKASPRWWWVYLVILILAPIVGGFRFGG